MKTKTAVWLIIAASLVLLGSILFASVMATLNWDFMKLSTVTYETNTHEIHEEFNGISMNTDTADIVFVLSEKETCRVVCREEARATHTVTVKDGTLTVELMDERSVSDFIGYIGLRFDAPKIAVYLPETKYASLFIKESTGDIEIPKDFDFNTVDISLSTGDVEVYASASEAMKIKTDTGNILVENITAGALDLSVSTGRVILRDVACKSVLSSGDTGDIFLKDVIAAETVSVKRSTGDVIFERCDAAELSIETDTGKVKGSLLSDKVFITQTDTGRIKVPQTVTGGKCEVSTDTGNITITID
ncbi:MAG: DUF4097 family beta strand repeat protein [Clostridia bacterium]|nr:DUF4097 family beta strand repeat protein [Clostridia bacterium]